MAFDACMTAAVANELKNRIIGARVEKIQQPEKDEVIFLLHRERTSFRLSVSASANCPKINITSIIKENPLTAPMFCMLLRKHLTGAKIIGVRQLFFERIIEIEFDVSDELGFTVRKYIIAEIMGKYSNIILCDESKKILGSIKHVDFTVSRQRQVLPGMEYELPPPQNKKNPLEANKTSFEDSYKQHSDIPEEKFICDNYLGFALSTAREIVFQKNVHKTLWVSFEHVTDIIKNGSFNPCIILNKENEPVEYSFMPLYQYGNEFIIKKYDSFGVLFDDFFGQKDKLERIKQRSSDISHLIGNIQTRLIKKKEAQLTDLLSCADKEKYKLYGDIITSNLYLFNQNEKLCKQNSILLTNYYDENLSEIEIPFDKRITPAQNAQRYYKKYTKAKSAETELNKQLTLTQNELEYIRTIYDAMNKAENETDLNEIKLELFKSGYASRIKNYNISSIENEKKKKAIQKPLEFKTSGGYRVLCGKNNIQNDYLTFNLAEKSDWWFHVKGEAGSHVVLFLKEIGTEPPESDFTEAAEIAAFYSQMKGSSNIPVDYTLIKNIKKPPSSKPGYVTYQSNWTAYVTPKSEKIIEMRTES